MSGSGSNTPRNGPARAGNGPDRAETGPQSTSRSLVPAGGGDERADAPGPTRKGAGPSRLEELADFAAHVFGQPGRKRGLKGGPPVLQQARAAYLEAEWSGPNDRRTRAGRITKTEV